MIIRPLFRRSFFGLTVCAALLLLSSLAFAQEFEGDIMMQMSSPMLGEQKIDIVYSIKGDKILQSADDPKQGKINIFTDTKTGTQTIVLVAQKQGMQFDQASVEAAMKNLHLPKFEPIDAGKKEKIAGYNCELYTMTMSVDTMQSQEMDMWVTKELPKDLSAAIRNCVVAGMKATGIKSDVFLKLFSSGYSPVRIEMKEGGVTQIVNEYKMMERKKLDDAIFIIPADIKVNKFDPNAPPPGAPGH